MLWKRFLAARLINEYCTATFCDLGFLYKVSIKGDIAQSEILRICLSIPHSDENERSVFYDLSLHPEKTQNKRFTAFIFLRLKYFSWLLRLLILQSAKLLSSICDFSFTQLQKVIFMTTMDCLYLIDRSTTRYCFIKISVDWSIWLQRSRNEMFISFVT